MSKKNDKSKKGSENKKSKKEVKKEKKISKNTASKPMKPQFVWPKDTPAMKKEHTKLENTLHPEEAGFASFEEPKLDGTEMPFIFANNVPVETSTDFDDIKNRTHSWVKKIQDNIKKAYKFFVRKMKGLD